MKTQTKVIFGILIIGLILISINFYFNGKEMIKSLEQNKITGFIMKGMIEGIKPDIIREQRINVLTNTLGVSEINPEVSDIICNNKECWSTTYQKNVINTEWRIKKYYCSEYEYKDIPDLNGGSLQVKTGNCLTYTDYTSEELISLRDAFVEQRINDYADTLINDEQDNSEQNNMGGQTTVDI